MKPWSAWFGAKAKRPATDCPLEGVPHRERPREIRAFRESADRRQRLPRFRRARLRQLAARPTSAVPGTSATANIAQLEQCLLTSPAQGLTELHANSGPAERGRRRRRLRRESR